MKYINTINSLEGWCTEDKIVKLYDLIIEVKPYFLVEIGVFGGKSLLSQAFALKENNKGIIHLSKLLGPNTWWSNTNTYIKYVDAS